MEHEPAIAGEPVRAPIVVTGLGRSGTTLLHELLACDPDNRPPLLWEYLHTVPAGERSRAAVGDPGDRPQLCDDEITLMDEMVPAFTAMHENGGNLPTEDIFGFAHQFSSDMYTGLYNVAEYTIWRSSQDQAPIYDWHRRMLQTMQWATPTTRWVLKAPSHLSALPLLFATYPDAKVVITHRDPLRVVGSLADLMATLHYMHSNHVDHAILVEFMCMGLEHVMDEVTAERDSGSLPQEQISDVLYHDLVKDPVATIEALYRRWNSHSPKGSAPTSRRISAPGTPTGRTSRLLLQRYRPRSAHPPRPRRPLSGAIRGPLRGLKSSMASRNFDRDRDCRGDLRPA